MLKKILVSLMFIFIASVSFAEAKGMSLSASSGLVTIPSANTLSEHEIMFGTWIIGGDNDTGYMPRVLISPIERLEIGVGADFVDKMENSYIVSAKYQIYRASDVKIALGFNYQSNGNVENGKPENNTNYQLFLAFTWDGGFGTTSSYFGKTFGDAVEDSEIDFGIGFEKMFYRGDYGGLGLVFDFTNTPYRRFFAAPDGAGDSNRGMFNGGLRVKATIAKVDFNIDLIAMDVLDDQLNWAISLGAALKF